MVQFSFTVEGEEQVSRMLSRTTEKIADMAPFFQAAGVLMQTSMEEQFGTEGGRTGGWAPLSERYAADKAKKYGSRPILQASGALIGSLVGGGGGHIERVQGNDTLEFGSSIPYGTYHQTGTSRMPQRRILDLTDGDRRSLMKLLQRHMFGARL